MELQQILIYNVIIIYRDIFSEKKNINIKKTICYARHMFDAVSVGLVKFRKQPA